MIGVAHENAAFTSERRVRRDIARVRKRVTRRECDAAEVCFIASVIVLIVSERDMARPLLMLIREGTPPRRER